MLGGVGDGEGGMGICEFGKDSANIEANVG